MLRLFFIAEIDSDGSGTVDFDGNLIFLILEKLRKVSTFLLSFFSSHDRIHGGTV